MNPNSKPIRSSVGLPPEQFATAFPFHFAVDKDFTLFQAGATLRRICPDVQLGAKLDQIFRVIRPEGHFTFDWVFQNKTYFFLLEHRATQLQLRGEFIWLPEAEILLFLGSPWFTDASEIAARGLGFEDFAVHDPVVDMLQVYQSSKLALADAKKLAGKLAVHRAELRIANERLRQQEAYTRKLALVATRTDNGVALTDPNGLVEWVNDAFTRMTGYTLEEVRGKKPGAVLQGPRTDPATVAKIREGLAAEKGFSVEILNYTKSRQEVWAAIEVQPIRDEQGCITNWMGIRTDITERKKSEALLLQANMLQRAMIEGAGYAIIATDTQGVIQIFNPAAERMLGHTAAEIIGKQTPEVFHVAEEVVARAQELTVELGHEVKPGFTAFIAKSELGRPDQREWTYVRKDGSRFPVLLSVTTLFDNQCKPTGYLGLASDLTERKRDEEKLRATLSELERFNRVMINREDRIMELKHEVNRLHAANGQPPAYPSVNESQINQPKSN